MMAAAAGILGGWFWVVVLNGAPRSGKSSIAAVIQETFDGPWMNLGVDVFSRCVTSRPRPPRRPSAAASPVLPPAAFPRLAADP